MLVINNKHGKNINNNSFLLIFYFVFIWSLIIFCFTDTFFQIFLKTTLIKEEKNIRLVVFDMGDTLWTEIREDIRAVPQIDKFFYMIDENHMFFQYSFIIRFFIPT